MHKTLPIPLLFLAALVAALFSSILLPAHAGAQETHPAAPGYCPTLTRDLKRGDTDARTSGQVTELQKFLVDYYDLNPASYISGYFGRLTQTNVIRFQGEQNLPAFGYVGPLTRARISQICATGTHTTTTTNTTNTNQPCTFNNQTVLHGSAVTAYERPSVPYGSFCLSEARSCVNGFLYGSYQYSSCTVTDQQNQSCAFSGQSIPHGTTVTAYESSSVPYNQTCKSQIRTCDNGTLSGSYTTASCTVQAPPTYAQGSYYSQGSYGGDTGGASCSLDGATVPSGKSRTFYKSASQAATDGWGDGRCSSIAQVRSCSNGSLSGDSVYSKATCSDYGTTLTAAPPGGPAPLKVTFMVPHTSNSGGVFPTISFGDGASYTGTGDSSFTRFYVDHTYANPGTYTVTTSGGFSYDPHETIIVTVN